MTTPDRVYRSSRYHHGTPGSAGSADTAGSGYGGRVGSRRYILQHAHSPPGGLVRSADDDEPSPRSGVHGRRRLSRDPHSPQEKASQRASNVRWMREWQPVDPRMA
eukprot:COSAG02_NODE_31982_length_524_cov_0.788235_1_plen_105_part_10